MTGTQTDASKNGTPRDAFSECGHPASELLDFHVNGSLNQDEAASVAAHVAECAICARDVRELQTLSKSIAAHGVAPAAWTRNRLVRAGLGAAAAVIAVGVILSLRGGPGSPGTRIASTSPAAAEITLDLGLGTTRDAAATSPRVDLAAGVSVLHLTLAPPVVSGADFRIGVIGPGDEEILPEMPLPPYDPMGRVAIAVRAARLAQPGLYRVVVRNATPGAGGPSLYSFEVSRPVGQE